MKPMFTAIISGIPCMTVTEHEAIVASLKRQWVGLTDEEIIEVLHPLVLADLSDEQTDYEIARAIEAKLKEKNSG